MTRPKLAPEVVFGLGDGAMSILGVVFYAAGHPELVLPIAASGGFSAACSMAGNQWLADDGGGWRAAAAMFAATLGGSILPALPYAVVTGIAAPILAVALLILVAVIIGHLRARLRRPRPYLATFLILGACVAAAVLCAVLIPAGGAA